jgi:hypothetical protein
MGPEVTSWRSGRAKPPRGPGMAVRASRLCGAGQGTRRRRLKSALTCSYIVQASAADRPPDARQAHRQAADPRSILRIAIGGWPGGCVGGCGKVPVLTALLDRSQAPPGARGFSPGSPGGPRSTTRRRHSTERRRRCGTCGRTALARTGRTGSRGRSTRACRDSHRRRPHRADIQLTLDADPRGPPGLVRLTMDLNGGFPLR